jgi:short-subunit dehydrogenase
VGAGFAIELSKLGINLVLIARKPGPLEETADAARANGVEVRALAIDLLDPDALDRVRAATDDVEVGLLIFNAGANSYGHEFVTGDLDGFFGVVTLNVTRQMEFAHHFGAKMKERGRGGMILVGSMSGFVGSEHMSVYSAVKAFGRIFAEGLWLELQPFGVHVVEFVLGLTRTPAMIREGLNFDLPGVKAAEPDDVAREGLEHLTDGPVWIAAGNFPRAEKQSGFPRDKIAVSNRAAVRKVMGFDD